MNSTLVSKEKIIAMVPARIGSTRLKMKNLALLDGKPLISYAIHAAIASNAFGRIILNSDNKIFQKIAQRYNVDFYLRPKHLGRSTTKSDDVVLDFMEKHPADILCWVNPISPLQTAGEITNIVNHFLKNECDSLITIENKQVHCVYGENPINFNKNEKFALTQQLKPVGFFVYSIMMWRTAAFIEAMKRYGFAFMNGKVGYYPVNSDSSLIVKTEKDLRLIHSLLHNKGRLSSVKYDSILDITE